jgi:hypothetical protein
VQIRLENINGEALEDEMIQPQAVLPKPKIALKSILRTGKVNKNQYWVRKAQDLNKEATKKRTHNQSNPMEMIVVPDPIKSLVVEDKFVNYQKFYANDPLNPEAKCEGISPAQLFGKRAALYSLSALEPEYKPQPIIIDPINHFKRVPCVFFHSPMGCTKGNDCTFIHHLRWAGRDTPNMHRYVRPFHELSIYPKQNEINLERLKHSLERDFNGQFNSKKLDLPEEGVFKISGDSTLTLEMKKNFELAAAQDHLLNLKREIVPIIVDSKTFNAEKGANAPLIFLPPERPPEDNFSFFGKQ